MAAEKRERERERERERVILFVVLSFRRRDKIFSKCARDLETWFSRSKFYHFLIIPIFLNEGAVRPSIIDR